MIDNDQNTMSDRNERLLLANAFAEPTILFSQVGAFTAGRSMGGFDECRSQPSAAFARFATQALACTHFIAGTHPCPRCEVAVTGKPMHLNADLGQHDLRNASIDTGNAIQALQSLG